MDYSYHDMVLHGPASHFCRVKSKFEYRQTYRCEDRDTVGYSYHDMVLHGPASQIFREKSTFDLCDIGPGDMGLIMYRSRV